MEKKRKTATRSGGVEEDEVSGVETKVVGLEVSDEKLKVRSEEVKTKNIRKV